MHGTEMYFYSYVVYSNKVALETYGDGILELDPMSFEQPDLNKLRSQIRDHIDHYRHHNELPPLDWCNYQVHLLAFNRL